MQVGMESPKMLRRVFELNEDPRLSQTYFLQKGASVDGT